MTLAAVVKQKLDGKYVLTLWHLQKARSLEFHQMRMAQRDAKKRFVVPQEGKETLSQKILKGKSGAVSACSMSVEERDMSEGSTEEDKWLDECSPTAQTSGVLPVITWVMSE